MSDAVIQAIIYGLLGTGGATFLWTVVKSVIAYQTSAEGREEKAVIRLERFEEECRRQLAWEREMGAHWFHVSSILERTLRLNGIEVPTLPPQPEPIGPVGDSTGLTGVPGLIEDSMASLAPEGFQMRL